MDVTVQVVTQFVRDLMGAAGKGAARGRLGNSDPEATWTRAIVVQSETKPFVCGANKIQINSVWIRKITADSISEIEQRAELGEAGRQMCCHRASYRKTIDAAGARLSRVIQK